LGPATNTSSLAAAEMPWNRVMNPATSSSAAAAMEVPVATAPLLYQRSVLRGRWS
jgi:hypothetical protein